MLAGLLAVFLLLDTHRQANAILSDFSLKDIQKETTSMGENMQLVTMETSPIKLKSWIISF